MTLCSDCKIDTKRNTIKLCLLHEQEFQQRHEEAVSYNAAQQAFRRLQCEVNDMQWLDD